MHVISARRAGPLAAALALAVPAAAQAQEAPVRAAAFPAPGVVTASPRTQISFRDATAAQLGDVVVRGSRSGRHSGTLEAHSDGAGASFVPARAFRQGELVTVRVGPAARVTGGDGRTYAFKVGRFVEGYATVGPNGAPTGDGANTRLQSRPDLAPPVPTLNLNASASGDQVLVAPKQGTGQGGPMVLDAAGRIQWFKPMPRGVRANDFRVQTYEGRPVLTWWEGRARGGSGRGEGVIADGAYRTIKRVDAGNGYGADLHEFLLTDHGTALLLAYQKVHGDLSAAGGPADGLAVDGIVQEVELATGLVRFEWHGIGNVPVTDSVIPVPASGNEGYDYLHPNAINPDGAGGYLLSARNTSTLYRLSPSGAIVWRLGGKHSDFTMGPGTHFELQHDAIVQADGTVRLLDNSAAGIRKGSRAIVLRLDTAARTATLVRAVSHPDRVLAATQGDVQERPGGGLFVGWGSQGRASEFDAAGTLVWDLALPKGYDTYRAYRFAWAGRPATAPRLRAVAADGATRVSMSWNGSTEVRAWRVLAGASADALAPAGDTAWSGLETTVTVPAAQAVAVQALDGSGAVLAQSATVAVPGRG